MSASRSKQPCNFETHSGQLREAALAFRNYPKLLGNGISQNSVQIRRDDDGKGVYCSSTSCKHNRDFACRNPIIGNLGEQQ